MVQQSKWFLFMYYRNYTIKMRMKMNWSFHRKRRLRTENEQMSTPDPAIALKIPPTNPVRTKTNPFHIRKSGIESNVFRLYCLFFCIFNVSDDYFLTSQSLGWDIVNIKSSKYNFLNWYKKCCTSTKALLRLLLTYLHVLQFKKKRMW